MQTQEIFVDWTAEHQRCTSCGDIVLKMTQNFIMCMSDGQLAEMSADRLPPDFDVNTLPDGKCPDCEVAEETDIPFETVEEAKVWLGEGNIITELCDDAVMSKTDFIAHANFLRAQVREDRSTIRNIIDELPLLGRPEK